MIDWFVHGPEHGVDEQFSELDMLEIIRMSQGRIKDASSVIVVCPGHWF